MNSLQDNKQLAASFFARFDANDIDGALATLADDATWWLAGKPDQLPGTGTLSKEQIARVFRRMTAQLEDGLRMRVKHMVAEGDTVALEVQSHGTLKNGRVYDNEYHTVMRVRDGRICEVREYYDSLHVFHVWYQR
ncbi:nuclear transport factor 2 family protein [Ideonella sp. BN130291]|uniref:nuclear transport factor 2 family protein n=1 Tax=Ideonella sp. BN130291 TaxID=3112940 RepID=UPI002E257924|nr:nuclear transport factor 2 family protein [Ideonella sp. BN130291]